MTSLLILGNSKLIAVHFFTFGFAPDNLVFGCRILVPEYGYMPLELVPMLVGFFTYKIATFIQAMEGALKTEV